MKVTTASRDQDTERSRIKSIVQDLFSSGEVEMDIDDSDIRKHINSVQTEGRNDRASLTKRVDTIDQTITGTLSVRVKELGEQIDKRLKGIQDEANQGIRNLADSMPKELEHLLSQKVKSQMTFDEAALRRVADEVFQTLFTDAVADAVDAGDLQPLPALLTVDPFFVENSQTAQIERCIRTLRHAMASGPSGAGKTYPIEQILRKHGKRYLKVSVADGLSFSDFVARANVRSTKEGTETYFTYGFLPFSMKAGIPLILDEIDQCQPEVVSVLNAALETRKLYVPQTGETIEAGDDWQVFMTCNTLRDSTGVYSGFRINSALLNRVVFIKADYLDPKEEIGILKRVGLHEKDAKVIVAIFQGLRAAYAAGKLTQAPSTRLAVRIARCLLGHDDNGKKVDAPLGLGESFAFCFLDGLPENEVKEAAEVIKHAI